jgi:hypothetical protein
MIPSASSQFQRQNPCFLAEDGHNMIPAKDKELVPALLSGARADGGRPGNGG